MAYCVGVELPDPDAVAGGRVEGDHGPCERAVDPGAVLLGEAWPVGRVAWGGWGGGPWRWRWRANSAAMATLAMSKTSSRSKSLPGTGDGELGELGVKVVPLDGGRDAAGTELRRRARCGWW